MSMVLEGVDVEVDDKRESDARIVGMSALTTRLMSGHTCHVQEQDEFLDDQDQGHGQNISAGRLRDEGGTWRTYMRALLFSIAAEPEAQLRYRTVDLCMRMLEGVMSNESVYPSATPEGDGGITLEWISGKWLIELDLEADGQYFLLHSGGDGVLKTKQRGMVHDLSLSALRGLVASFTEYVVNLNPTWRSLYV